MDTDLSELVRKAGKDKRIIEFQCPYIPKFYVKIAFASKFVLGQIREISKEIFYDARTRVREEKLNDDKLRREYAKQIVIDWRGLTVDSLKKILPSLEVEKDVDVSKEILYSAELTIAMLEVSLEFESWILDIASNVENFVAIAEQKEKEKENL